MARTIKQRILEKVNEIPTEGALSTDDTILQAWNDNLWKVAKTLPPSEMLTHAKYIVDANANATTGDRNMTNKLVLLVERKDSGANYRASSEIQLHQSVSALDSDSMFYATEHSPVFWYESRDMLTTLTQTATINNPADSDQDIQLISGNDQTFNVIASIAGSTTTTMTLDTHYTLNGDIITILADQCAADEIITITYTVIENIKGNVLCVAPENSGGEKTRIWYFEKQIWDTTTTDLDYDNALDATILGFPDHAIEVVVLLTAVTLLKELMALQALEDEDAEIVQMITALIQSYEASINKEMEVLRPDLQGASNEN